MKKFGQVEPNHLSAQRTGQIYAQLPAAITLENGMFAKYDYEAGKVNLTGDGEWLLVYNEVKVYDNKESYNDFVMPAGGVPRLFKTNVGDIYTTNTFASSVKIDEVEVGNEFVPGSDGYLAAKSGDAEMVWKAVKVYTMPDGLPGVKLQRIK